MRFRNSSFSEVYEWNKTINGGFCNICSDFMKQMSINYICYGVHYNSGKQLNIMTDMPFFAFGLKYECFAAKSKIFIRNGLPKDNIQNIFNKFNILQGISFYQRLDDRIVAWSFSTGIENTDFINTYINSIPIFEQFIKYLNFKIKENALKNSSFPLLLTGYVLPEYNTSTEQNLSQLISKLKIKRYYYNDKNYFTVREYQSIFYLTQGETAKGIARLMNISPKTVEAFLDKIKLKTNTRTKDEMIKFYNAVRKNL